MSDEPFHGPKLKINRAKRHISDFQAAIKAFLKRDPYRLIVEEHTETGQYASVIRVKECIPRDFPAYIGDVVHNLRTALDLLACDLVALNGKSTKDVYFPFADSADRLEKRIEDRNVNRANPDVVDIIRGLKPYKGGDYALRALHDLDVTDKHKTILPVTYATKIPDFSVGRITVTDNWIGPLEDGIIAATFPRSANLNLGQEFKGSFLIAFDRDQPFEGKPILPTLHQLAQLVSGIVEMFEAHCFR